LKLDKRPRQKDLQEDETLHQRCASRSQQCDAGRGAAEHAIGEFNLKRMAINNEAAEGRPQRGAPRASTTTSCATIYAEMMQNPSTWRRITAAKNEFDALMQRVTGVLSMCAEGQDPDGCDPDACGCTGSCATCGGGCH
jgi:hypothetical protein